MRDDDVLFWDYDWNRVAEGQKLAARRDVESFSGAVFADKSVEELADQLGDKYSLTVPELDLENISVKQREVQIDVSNDRMRYFSDDGPHYRTGTAIDVRIPFTGDKDMFKIKPNTWTSVIPRGHVEGNSVMFTIIGTSLEKEQVKSEIDKRVAELQEWLGFQSKTVVGFPEDFRRTAIHTLEARKQKITADADLVSGLGYKME